MTAIHRYSTTPTCIYCGAERAYREPCPIAEEIEQDYLWSATLREYEPYDHLRSLVSRLCRLTGEDWTLEHARLPDASQRDRMTVRRGGEVIVEVVDVGRDRVARDVGAGVWPRWKVVRDADR